MTLSSFLIRTLRAAVASFAIVFGVGLVAALLGVPQPLADIIAMAIGAAVLLAVFDSVRH